MNLPRAFLTLLLGAVLSGAPLALGQDAGGLGGGPGGGPGGKDDGKGGGPSVKPPNDEKAPLPVRVNQAIDSGVAYLLGKNENVPKVFRSVLGNWSPEVLGSRLYDPNSKGDVFVHPTGCTSLALYALLKSGVPKDDPAIKKGFNWLKTASGGITKGKALSTQYRVPNGTYELAVLVLALEAKANPHKREAERERELKFKLKKGERLKLDVKLDPEDEVWMKDLVDALMKRWNKGKGWRYGLWTGKGFHNGPRGDSDLSASNLTMLALLAAERCGVRNPDLNDAFYASVLQWTLTMQEKEGPEVRRWDPSLKADDARYAPQKDHARGFTYLGLTGADPEENVASGSMTCCGLANIVICSSILAARESRAYTPELEAASEKAWWDGVAWLDYNWTVEHNTNCFQGYHYYYLYCLERACDLKRINLLAGHPWYNEGAQVLVDQQLNANTGAWTKEDTHKPCDLLNTCFALLFLNRSTPAITAGD
jgi:hypothetical protein